MKSVLLSFRGYFGDTAGACVRAPGKLGLGARARGRSGVKTHRPAQNSDFWPEPARLPEKPNGDAWLGGGVLKWGRPPHSRRENVAPGAFSGSWRAFRTHAADTFPRHRQGIDHSPKLTGSTASLSLPLAPNPFPLARASSLLVVLSRTRRRLRALCAIAPVDLEEPFQPLRHRRLAGARCEPGFALRAAPPAWRQR